MFPSHSTVGEIAADVNAGLLSRERAVEILSEAGFTDPEAILRDLCGEVSA